MIDLLDSVKFNIVMLVIVIVAGLLNTLHFILTGEWLSIIWLIINVLCCSWFIYKVKSIKGI